MSYLHIKMKKVLSKDDIVRYEIFSPDFNEGFQWESLGMIELDTKAGTYKHLDSEMWSNKGFILSKRPKCLLKRGLT